MESTLLNKNPGTAIDCNDIVMLHSTTLVVHFSSTVKTAHIIIFKILSTLFEEVRDCGVKRYKSEGMRGGRLWWSGEKTTQVYSSALVVCCLRE